MSFSNVAKYSEISRREIMSKLNCIQERTQKKLLKMSVSDG